MRFKLICFFLAVFLFYVVVSVPADSTPPPAETTSVEPKSETTKAADESSTVKPGDKTTKKPDEETTKKPDNVTTIKPDDATTNKPNEETTKKPNGEATEIPVQESTEKSPDETTKKPDKDFTTRPSVIALGVNTGDKLDRWKEAAKNAMKGPSELVKESVNIFKDKMKLSGDLGEAAVVKGIANLGQQGVTTVSDLGRMGLNISTTIANKTLGLIHKISDMMPFGGKILKGSVSLGRKGLSAAHAIGENFFDNLLWLADNGFGWLKNTASSSNSLFRNKTDSLVSNLQNNIESGSNRIGQFIASGISKLPIFKVNASLTLG